ncbi:AAA family ATPase [Streptomyces sp. TRM43335]|uniref:Nuclease SbcCD subunit C n=1 Tax=Streptomyces taklimakanensis TaxID=2569853 RepID=A0A6G2BIP0_9ACTN|nr:SMC family ATPase [Streptomyces taklimakanensis]MTE22157.1 AAA family ATPase [Streptomyces taklimakanensis]
MRLHRLTVTAFGPFGGTQTVDFDALSAAGLFLLHGPTGAGKTSVLDAVCYALYGGVPGARQAFGGRLLRSDHADPTTLTEVVLDLTVGGRRLEVTRLPEQLRPKRRGTGTTTEKAQSRLREYDAATGTWKALSRSHQEIGEELSHLLGMSREQFCQVVLLPQGDFARFLRAGAEDRARLLGRLFDTGRFAAVERHLAELRTAAQGRVRDGDERLLALAQRMRQAAGTDASAPDGSTLDDLSAGDPGLAGAVLEWGAQARSHARERLDSTTAAHRAAEEAHTAARRHLEEVRERDRRARRLADARRRADALAADAERHRTDRARLERSRAAEAVAPLLEARERTEDESRRAARAEEHARSRLPADLARAPAEHLADLERAARRELGTLEAARHAEERCDRITDELARLDRESGEDEGLLREAEEWLAGWEATHDARRREADAATEATSRAERLARHLDAAVRRLEAARHRDTLAATEATSRAEALEARERAAAAQQDWLDVRARRLDGIAAELAGELADGAPCMVCGSPEHPAPARPGARHVDRRAEEEALERYRRAEDVLRQAELRLENVRERLTEAAKEAGEASAASLADRVAALEAEHAEARRTAAGAADARAALERARREYEARLAARQDAERRTAARTSRRETLQAERAGLAEQVARARGAAASVADRARGMEHRVTALAAAVEAASAAEAAASRLKETDARLADAVWRAGFDTPRAAADALLTDHERRALQRRVDERQAEEAAVAAALADPELAGADGLPATALAAAEAGLEEAVARLKATSSAEAAARDRCAELDRLSARALADARALAPLREEYDRVARLAALTAGTSAENERRMRLESYVLAARLEQVAAAAGARLAHMSGGRYTLVHSDARASGRGRSGLGLHVIDAWTGSERDTATLSGGETFFASLALALGLADVVTEEAGGVRLDTLFIDEGFGSLDDQTLDEVLDVLDSLRERDRSVGIVSHVPDLRRRVPAQLEVVKGRAGSTVRHRVP